VCLALIQGMFFQAINAYPRMEKFGLNISALVGIRTQHFRVESLDHSATEVRPVTHYQVDLTGRLDQVYLSGLLDSEWLAQARFLPHLP
jgi:hypothetical protein